MMHTLPIPVFSFSKLWLRVLCLCSFLCLSSQALSQQITKAKTSEEIRFSLVRKPVNKESLTPLSDEQLRSLNTALNKRIEAWSDNQAKLSLSQTHDGQLLGTLKGMSKKELNKAKHWLFSAQELGFHQVERQLTTATDLSKHPQHKDRLIKTLTPLGSNPQKGFTENEKLSGAGEQFLLYKTAEISSEDIESARVFRDPNGYFISITLTEEGGTKMRALTKKILKQRLALVLDGVLISAPKVYGEFGKKFHITADFSREEASTLARAFQHPLPIDGNLKLIE